MSDQHIFVYRKQGEPVSVCEELIVRLFPGESREYALYTDIGIDTVALSKMRRDIQKAEDAIVVVSSAKLFGTSSADILRELEWFAENGVIIVMADSKASFTTDAATNALVLQTLIDVYASMPSTNITSFKVGAGRKKIPYPENWETLYEDWEDGLITATEFMEKTGLKKGTFYHLAASYKEQRNSLIERRHIV